MFDSIRKFSILPSFAAGMFYFSTAAAAPIDLTINAQAHCFTTTFGTGGISIVTLTPGRYVASLINSSMSCNGGVITDGCSIDTVILQTKGGSTAAGNKTYWGVSVKKNAPVVVDIPGTAPLDAVAFVVDSDCSDNTGQGTLRFQKAN